MYSNSYVCVFSLIIKELKMSWAMSQVHRDKMCHKVYLSFKFKQIPSLFVLYQKKS